ncbi:acyl-CoA dehydrogenase family protein [Pacificispira sp.]|uniref:acyl-CoA dehydrogenase family protein n=1 Tax=Pacificispira sp. TaxID=2888761 RepID=UPI003B5155E1
MFDRGFNRIGFTDDDALVLDVAQRFAAEKGDPEAVRKSISTERGYEESLWNEMVAMGWPGILIEVDYGGAGMGVVAAVAILEALGRRLCPSPLLPTILASRLISDAASERQKQEWLPALAEGTIATVALHAPKGSWSPLEVAVEAVDDGGKVVLSGSKHMVLDAGAAEFVVVNVTFAGKPALAVLQPRDFPPGSILRQVVIDETRRCFKLVFDGMRISMDKLILSDAVPAALERAGLLANLLISAEMVGGHAGALDLVLDYLNLRETFGRKIGANQALKHPCVDIALQLEGARSLVYGAATAAARSPDCDETEILIRMAKAHAGAGFDFAGDRAVQFHGGIGFTYECNAHLFLRRAIWSQVMFGDIGFHRHRLAQLLFDQGTA